MIFLCLFGADPRRLCVVVVVVVVVVEPYWPLGVLRVREVARVEASESITSLA